MTQIARITLLRHRRRQLLLAAVLPAPAALAAEDARGRSGHGGNGAGARYPAGTRPDRHRDGPKRSARLSAATSGLVATLQVDTGSRVQAGQLLLELDPELAQLQLDSALAQVEQADTGLGDARRRL